MPGPHAKDGISALVGVMLAAGAQAGANALPDVPWIDEAVVLADGSLQCARIETPVPAGEYQVLHLFALSVSTSVSGSHSHTVTLPDLASGDYVLVAFALEWSHPWVIGKGRL